MKVLTIISKLEMGGIEKTLLSCLPFLSSKGIEIIILCEKGGKLQSEYEAKGARIIDFAGYKKPFLDAQRLKQVLKSEKIDLVHSRYGHTSGVFAKVCHSLAVPFIVSIHNEKAMFKNSWQGKPVLNLIRDCYLRYHKRLTLKYSSLILGHSKANLNYYSNTAKVYSDKLKVIYNGVDFSKFIGYPDLPEDKKSTLKWVRQNYNKIFIHIGKFKEQKNHSFLIDVFNELNPKENGYYLLLLGEGSGRIAIEQKVDSLDLAGNVLFLGMETNIAPYLEISDVFFFPSIYEGFGNVLVEAQYMKLLIAASDISPHYEATYHRYHEFFYDPYDKQIAKEKIKSLLSKDLDIIKDEAFEFARKFTIENMSEELTRIYRSYDK